MGILRSHFQSKVARRLFFLFLISALLPLITLSSLTYYYIQKQTIAQSESYVRHLAKSVGMSIYDKLHREALALAKIRDQAENTSIKQLQKLFRNKNHPNYQFFKSAGIYRSEQYRALLAEDKQVPPLSFRQRKKIRQGETVLFYEKDRDNTRLFLSLPIFANDETENYIIAELNNDLLWNLQDIIPSTYKLCVFSASNTLLHCNLTDNEREITARQMMLLTSHAQLLDWQAGQADYMGFYWTIFLEASFSSNNWRTLVGIPMENIYESRSLFFKLFLPIITLAILLVAFLSSHQIRRYLVPLSKLTNITRKISNGDLSARVEIRSRDEFEDLGSLFNDMARRLQKQFQSLETMAEVDRVILSATDEAYVTETVLLRVKDILDCKTIKLLLFSHNLSSNTIQALTKNATASHLFEIVDQDIDLNIGNDVSKDMLLIDKKNPPPASIKNFIPLHVHFAAVYPLMFQDTLIGIVITEFSRDPSAQYLDLRHAKELCDRLAVALSNASWEDKLYRQANYDETTQLPNRTLMLDRLDQALVRANRDNTQTAVLFLDIDRFKIINDTFSHAAGDVLLRIIAERLSSCISYADTVCRFSGDKFVVLIADMESSNDALNKIRESVENLLFTIKSPFTLGNHEISVSASVGIALYPADSSNRNTLLKYAEVAMYHAKSLGTGNYQFYSEDINSKNIAQLVLENDLRQAIEKDQLTLYYQPQVSAKDGQLLGLEALIRWNHAELGTISPNRFLPLVRRIGLMNALDNFVLENACKQLRQWLNNGIAINRLAINMSADQFRESKLITYLDSCLAKYQLEPSLIELEITEDTLMADIEATTQLLKDLETRGIRLAIDDFGTGYSSLNYLAKFPLHYLKIDQSFVKDIQHDANMEAIISATIALAHSLSLTVVAEGVETPQQLEFLQKHDCDIIQGYIVCRPVPEHELVEWMDTPELDSQFTRNG